MISIWINPLLVILSSGLVTARQNCTLKGYLVTFRGYVENLKDAVTNKPSSGPVVMNDFEPAVEQLWDEVKGVIEAVTRTLHETILGIVWS